MDNVNTCDNCGTSFPDSFEYNNHTRTCIVNTNYNEDINKNNNSEDDNNNNDYEDNNNGGNTSDFNPLNIIFNEYPSKIMNTALDIISSTPNHTNTRRCTICYQSKDISEYHKRKYRCKECLKTKVKCPQCNISLTKNNLTRHIKEVHEEKVNVKCLKCDKIYNKRYFISHKCVINNFQFV